MNFMMSINYKSYLRFFFWIIRCFMIKNMKNININMIIFLFLFFNL